MLEILSSNCEVFDIFLDLESHRNQAKEKKVIVLGMACPRALESVFWAWLEWLSYHRAIRLRTPRFLSALGSL